MKASDQKTVKQLFFSSIIQFTAIIIVIMFTGSLAILYSHFSQNRRALFLSQLHHIDEQLNSYLDSALELARSVSSDADIQQYVSYYENPSGEFTVEDQIAMTNILSSYLSTYDYLHSITVYSADKSLIAATTPLLPAEELSADVPDLPAWISSTKPPLTSLDSHTSPLSRFQPFYRIENGRLLGYVEISISEEALNSLMIPSQKNESLIMVDQDNIIRATSGKLPVGTFCPINVISSAAQKQKYSLDYRSFYLQGQNERLHWNIISIIGFYDYAKPLFPLLAIVSLIALICFLLSKHIATKLAENLTAPIYHLIRHTQKIKNGLWLPIDPYPVNTEDLALLYQEFNHMVLAQEQLKNNLIEEQISKDKLTLDLLQQQVNPHFLYNTLDNICSLAEIGEIPVLIQLVMNLSQFYKNALSNGHQFLQIKDELSLCEAYLQIMHVRYYQKFEHEIVCPPDLSECYCMKLLLQPIIENSIYHGIKENSRMGFIRICLESAGDDILIAISDNGIGLTPRQKPSSSGGGFGLANIRQRIRLYYGEGYGLSIQNRPEGGCITTIRIPKYTDIPETARQEALL